MVNETIIKNIVESSSDDEYESLFLNLILYIPLIQKLEILNHPQPTNPIFTDNGTERGL